MTQALFYSIVMTTCSTVLALGAMPLLLYLYCRGFSGLENVVPYSGISIALIMTIVPCAVGIAIHHWAPRYSQIVIKVYCNSGAKRVPFYFIIHLELSFIYTTLTLLKNPA